MSGKPQPSVFNVCNQQNCGRILRTRMGLRAHLLKVHSIILEEKECTKCGRTLPSGKFKISQAVIKDGQIRNYRVAECDDCRSLRAKLWRKKRPESHIRRDNKKHRAATYGLTNEEYEKYWELHFEEQKGLCEVCKERPPVVLDHYHTTGTLRGLLCRQCNLAIGYLKDDPAIGINLANYLKKYEMRENEKNVAFL